MYYFIMNSKLILFLIILGIVFLFTIIPIEFFDGLDTDMLEFRRLDGSLIRKLKIGSSYDLWDSEVLNLFKQDQVIRVIVPLNYELTLVYKYKDKSKGYGKTVILPAGSADIKKEMDDKIISQLSVKNIYGLNTNNTVVIRNPAGDILLRTGINDIINWDNIYTTYGYNDYYLYYPTGPIRYHYYHGPNYRNKYYRRPRYNRIRSRVHRR